MNLQRPWMVAKTAALLLCVGACQTTVESRDQAAVIVDPDAASRSALADTLSSRFGGMEIRLADDTLTQSSLLTLETGSASIEQVQGMRVVSEPYRFRLVRNSGDCILIDERDGSRHRLDDTRCQPQ